jgi:beta-glucosidase
MADFHYFRTTNHLPVMKSRILLFLVILTCAQALSAQDKTSAMNTFVSNLMKKMTLDEKIGQLNLVTPGGAVTGAVVSKDVDEKIRKGAVGGLFGISGPEKIRRAQQIAVENSRLKIPLIFGMDVIHGYKTGFPVPLGIACSWDLQMIEQSARIAAQEATADGLCWTFSPMVDIARDPRWGRVAEGSGEDTYLGSRIGAAMVRGYQGTDLSKDNTMLACVKHFALYGAAEAGRDYNTVDMSRLRMYQDYLPPYKAAIDAGAGSVMSSFNVIDGVPATGNRWLLTELLRKQWGFKGMVVSDYTSVSEMINHGMGDLQAVSALALKAGLDMDMVAEGMLNTLEKSLAEGKVTQAEIDQACRRILEAKYKLGLFEDPYRYVNESRPEKQILTPANRQFARELAAKSAVLLKNDNNILPLKKTGSIALVGPLANDHSNQLGTWAVSGDPSKSVTVMQGIQDLVGNAVKVNYARGANITDDPELAKRVNVFGLRAEIDARNPEEMIREAVAAASASDVVVAVLGEASEMTGEAASRTDLHIPGSQLKLIDALVATGKPVVLVLMNGRPLVLTGEPQKAGAILDSWFGGIESGHAVADLLFGDRNPSGKLTMTFPRSVGQVPIYYNHLNTGRPMDPNNKFSTRYLDESNDPLYPFGYGLSYSHFTYGPLTLGATSMSATGNITATVTVTNDGTYNGEETVQLYIRDMVGSVSRPLLELKQFKKLALPRGESKTVSFTITRADLSFLNAEGKSVLEPGDFKVFVGGNSRDLKEASFSLK